MGSSYFCLFEFGSTSLKFHYQISEDAKTQTLKVPWEIGHEVFHTGHISRVSLEKAVSDIQLLLNRLAGDCDPKKVLAFATGVFREARNILDFVFQIRLRVGLKVRVISSDQEAALLQSLYLQKRSPAQGFAFDLGSGSLQWVHVRSSGRSDRGSLPIGVIRIFHEARDAQGDFSPDLAYYLAGQHLSTLPRLKTDQVVGTGGTVRAMCKLLGLRLVSRMDIADLIEKVRAEGSPSSLMSHRLALFLPGVVLVERLMAEVGAREIQYEDLSVGKAMLEKVLPFYRCPIPPRPSEIMKQIHLSAALPAS